MNPLQQVALLLFHPKLMPIPKQYWSRHALPMAVDNFRMHSGLRLESFWDRRAGILVPTSAITRLGGQTFVFIVEEADPAEAEAAGSGAPPPGAGAQMRARCKSLDSDLSSWGKFRVINTPC